MKTRCPNPECALEFEIPTLEVEGPTLGVNTSALKTETPKFEIPPRHSETPALDLKNQTPRPGTAIDVPKGIYLDKRGHYQGSCPSCGQVAAFRSEEAQSVIDREYEKRRLRDQMSGGPGRDSDFIAPYSVLVEDVRSLWNVGSIFRSSDGAGFAHIYLCGITGAPPRKEIEKVSLGAEQNISWEYHTNPLVPMFRLKNSGVQIIGLEKSSDSLLLSQALEEGRIRPPLCLIVGNEVSGLSPQVMAHCDLICHLPMKGMKESLNVAVAFGIAAYMITEGHE